MATSRSTPTPPRVVLDTNLVLSAAIFRGGATAVLRSAWQRRRFVPLVSRATVGELIRVLGYPKFALTAQEREDLLSDYLPFCETVAIPSPLPPVPACRDPFDLPFLELAAAGRANFLVTGDRDLLGLSTEFTCPIVTSADFLSRIETP